MWEGKKGKNSYINMQEAKIIYNLIIVRSSLKNLSMNNNVNNTEKTRETTTDCFL